ncbi:MAG TPA: DUF58 domain-containing protein [Blastocatellia bacterium]|nr:DUF58 domain-containing protein [Blastocatellia bacterium]
MNQEKDNLLDPAFLRKLERLRIQARRAFPGTMRGERRSTRRGASVEFADFRKYEAGDDFRHVDWNIYARLERLMLRQFVEEEDVRIDILIDQSQSMRFGESRTKFDFARRAAAALTFLGISSLDRVAVATFDAMLRERMRALRGRGHLLNVLRFLDGLATDDESVEGQASAQTDLSAVLRGFQRLSARPGIVFVISDFLDAGGFRTEMKLLARRGFDLNLIQVLAADELSPAVAGDLLFVDSETGETREITVNERLVGAYKATLNEYTHGLESFCRSQGIGYTLVSADAAFEDLLLKNLIEARMAE